MGKMYIVLSDETERRLRVAVVTILGGRKGDLSSAIEVAIKEWLDRHATEADITKWVHDQLHERRPGRSRASKRPNENNEHDPTKISSHTTKSL